METFPEKKARGRKHDQGKDSPNVSTLIKHFLACHCSIPMTIEKLSSAEDIMHSNDRRNAYIGGFKDNPVAEEEI